MCVLSIFTRLEIKTEKLYDINGLVTYIILLNSTYILYIFIMIIITYYNVILLYNITMMIFRIINLLYIILT